MNSIKNKEVNPRESFIGRANEYLVRLESWRKAVQNSPEDLKTTVLEKIQTAAKHFPGNADDNSGATPQV